MFDVCFDFGTHVLTIFSFTPIVLSIVEILFYFACAIMAYKFLLNIFKGCFAIIIVSFAIPIQTSTIGLWMIILRFLTSVFNI